MSYDIKHQAELYLRSALSALVPGHRFLPLTGLGSDNAETSIEPPFSVIAITEAKRTHMQYLIYLCSGSVQVVTHADEATSETHATLVDQVTRALALMGSGSADGITLSGLEVLDTSSADDTTNQAHVDKISFSAGFHQIVS